MNTGTLFIVATPIGNLSDITLRAIETLKSVDAIACEDTRVSRKLLDRFDIKKPLISLHQHSDEKVISGLVDRLTRGENIAYITDGGTPGISDPGQKLIAKIRNKNCHPELVSGSQTDNPGSRKNLEIPKQVRDDADIRLPRLERTQWLAMTEKANKPQRGPCQRGLIPNSYNLKVIPIPGPSALAATVSVSGLVEKEFYFAGFLPKKKGRMTKFIELSKINVPIVIYESALRLPRTLADIEKYFGADAEVFIAREMTKMFEEYWGGVVREVIVDIVNHKLKGEVTLIAKRNKIPKSK